MVNWGIAELHRNSGNWDNLVKDIVKMEKKIFPKHESLARSFDEELKKRNSGLLYSQVEDGDVAGYVMYSWPSSISASITKLAGSISILIFLQPLLILVRFSCSNLFVALIPFVGFVMFEFENSGA